MKEFRATGNLNNSNTKMIMANITPHIEMRQLVYGKVQHKNYLPTINKGLLRGHCFYIKKMNVLCE